MFNTNQSNNYNLKRIIHVYSCRLCLLIPKIHCSLMHTIYYNMSSVDNLLAMGFNHDSISEALSASRGDMNAALELLLAGVDIGSEDLACRNNDRCVQNCQIIELTNSQYSYNNGASACTSIALNALAVLLSKIEANEIEIAIANGAESREWQSIISNGISIHQSVTQSFNGGNQSHLSVDEVYFMSSTLQMKLKLVSDIPVQGLLSKNYQQSFNSFIESIRKFGDPSKHLGVVITKPPESICLIIPPVNGRIGQEQTYYLFDSHSRPQMTLFSAYFLISADIVSIFDHLHTLFPVYDSDGDKGIDVFSQMYNMYEGFVFQLNS